MVRALEMVAPGTASREGLDNIQSAHSGGLIVIGDADELAFLFSGGIKLDLDYSPTFLYQLAKMDGAIVLSSNATKIAHANVQLTPDPTILTLETGTRHRTAERVSKQTDALVVAISERREIVSLYVDGIKYILEDIPVVLAKANQALATLDKYRSRLDQVSTRLTALEFEGGATLHDVDGAASNTPRPSADQSPTGRIRRERRTRRERRRTRRRRVRRGAAAAGQPPLPTRRGPPRARGPRWSQHSPPGPRGRSRSGRSSGRAAARHR